MSAAEIASIEGPYEYPGEDWRRSFYELFTRTRTQIRAERAKGKSAEYECGGRIWRAFELDDDDIDEVARAYATRICERGIAEKAANEIQRRIKNRKGRAL